MITVNGDRMDHEEGMTVSRVLEKCGYIFPLLIVQINGDHVPREKFPATRVSDGDTIEVIHMMSGG